MRALATFIAIGALSASAVAEAYLSSVVHEPTRFDPAAGESVTIRYTLTSPARVDAEIYDGRDLRVGAIAGLDVEPAGAHELRWDGRDVLGRVVPPDAYSYALVATSPTGAQSRWDPVEGAGEELEVEGLSWNRETRQMTYRLTEAARVRIRVGLEDDGPLLKTVVDWAAREPGEHHESWDGHDQSGTLELADHPALAWTSGAFTLPPNTLLVGPRASRGAFIEDLPPTVPRRGRVDEAPHRMLDFARQSAEQRRDFEVSLALPPNLSETREGVPIVREPVPVRLEVGGKALAQALNARSEAVFYVDGRFVFERETGFLPLTWVWDPSGHGPGLHHLTANIRGYEGHFGVGTTPVWVVGPGEPVEDQE